MNSYNATFSSLEDVFSGPGVLSETLSCQACAWLELRWAIFPVTLRMCVCVCIPEQSNLVYPPIFVYVCVAFPHLRWDSQLLRIHLHPYENQS